MNKSLNTLTSVQLKQAAALKEKIEGLEKQLAAILGDVAASAGSAPTLARKKKKFTMSDAAKAAISRAAKARWAKIKAAKKG